MKIFFKNFLFFKNFFLILFKILIVNWILGVEIFKHASRLCEARKPGKHYQVPNKTLSSDWTENLGMCVWRYCAHPKFRT